jgi:multiple sugar transport system permease protein
MMTTTAGQTAARVRTHRRPVSFYVSQVIRYTVLSVIGLILFTPFILAFLGSFKSNAEIVAWPPTLLPARWRLENWGELFATDMGGLPRESGMIAFGGTMGLVAFLLALVAGRMSSILGKERRALVALLLVSGVATLIAWGLITAVGGESPFIERLLIATGGPLGLSLVGFGVVTVFQQRRIYGVAQLTSLSTALTGGMAVTLIFYALLRAAGGATFVRWLLNTAILSLGVAVFQVVFCSMAAYAFARLRFPGRDAIFSFMLASMMIPGAVTLVPSYVLMAKIKLVNTPWALVLPGIVGAFGIFMLTQFFKSIPHELEEAALIDGASWFQIYYQVVLPLARPALLTLFILQFQGMWNAFLGPLLYLNTPDMYPLNIALMMFQQQYRYAWNVTLVGAMVNAAPILVLFFIFSKYYIEGVSYAGLKG